MTYEQFKQLYEAQLSIANLIDLLCKSQYNATRPIFVNELIKEAEGIGTLLSGGYFDNGFWLSVPLDTKMAYILYLRQNAKE